MTKINTKKAGFSLIELLFAMLFLSVIIFGVIKLQTSNLTLSNTKQLELKAHFYATQALEVVEALAYEDVAGASACTAPCYLSNGGIYSIKSYDTPPGVESLEDGLFERTIDHKEPGLDDASYVTVEVKWTDLSGEHTVSASRIIIDDD